VSEIRSFLRKFLHYLAPYRRDIIVMYAAAILNVAALISIPILIQRAIDFGIVPRDTSMLLNMAGFVAAAAALQFISFRTQGRIMMRVGNRVLFDLRRDLFGSIQRLSVPFFDANKSGKLMTRVTSDVQVLEELLMAGLDTVLVDVMMIFGLISAMIILNVRLSLVLLLVVPLLALIVFVLRNRIMDAASGIQKKLSGVNSYLNESLSGIRVVQAFARERRNIREFQRINGEYYDNSRRFYPLHAIFWQAVATLNTVSQGLVILVGGLLLYRDLITIGVIVAFLSYVTRLFQPMQKISNMLNQFSRAIVSGRRIFEILEEPVAVPDKENAFEPPAIRGEVEFTDVHFSYHPGEPVLKGVSFLVNPGQMCAIVGHTGSGKSTTIHLINRFYDIDSGHLKIDGRDIRDYSQRSLRSRMATVMQDPQIFSGSVAENIRFGRPEAGIDQVRQVARTLGIEEMIDGFPRGFDTEVGQNGGNISLGQRQLLAFARAMLRNPSILILDEASAYLDSETEAMVQKALGVLMEGRTSFVIAHRLSTIRNADQILVLEDGHIVERGNHEELIGAEGTYASYIRTLETH
jgi:ABC-type multidrug transport system fused ATPase/permease subunit